MDNLNILVEAKREYLEQLSILMCPPMIDVFVEMYEEAYKLSKGRKVLQMFQKLLKDVPEWNETMAKEHTDNIANRCAWFKDLVAAVFVSYVKILSAVRLNKDNKKLSVKLPTNEVFIHSCYKNVAKDLYKDPYIFSETQSEHTRNDKLYDRFSYCIETTVKELIPVQQILQTYMTTTDDMIDPQDTDLTEDNVDEYGGENQEMGEGEPMEGGDPSMENPEMQGEPMGEQPMGEQPMGEQPMGEQPMAPEQPQQSNPFENEFRTIKSGRPQPQAQPQQGYESEDLFPDAPDGRIKKPMY